MAYSALTEDETNAKAKLRQAFFKKLKDNDVDHKARIDRIYQGMRFFDHFNWRTDVADRSWGTAPWNLGTGTGDGSGGRGWVQYNGLNDGHDANFNPARPAFSVARIINGTAGSSWCVNFTEFALRFDAITAPLILEARVKLSADGAPFLGLREMRDENPGGNDRAGIWVERVDGTNWRAVSYNGSRNNGLNWAKPSVGTWFVLRIEWTSGQAIIKIDGATKDTLTTQLPTTTTLHGVLGCAIGSVSCNHDHDRIEMAADGLGDAA